MTVAGMLELAKTVKSQMQCFRQDSKYDAIFREAQQKIESLDLDELSLPRTKKTPKRLCGPTEGFVAESVSKYFHIEYLKLVDTAIQQLSDRIIERPGLNRYCELEEILRSTK